MYRNKGLHKTKCKTPEVRASVNYYSNYWTQLVLTPTEHASHVTHPFLSSRPCVDLSLGKCSLGSLFSWNLS